MKNLFCFIVAFMAITIFYSCSDNEASPEAIIKQETLSKTRDACGNGSGVGTNGGDPDGSYGPCAPETCYGLPNDYVQWGMNYHENPCDICVWFVSPDGTPIEGELCVVLTSVADLENGGFIDDIYFSGNVSDGEPLCYPIDIPIGYYATAYLITDEGCVRTQYDYTQSECCCSDPNASLSFNEVGTDINYQTLCGRIEVSLDTDCAGPFSWSYSPEPGTGLKGSGSGSGCEFDIYAQNDCGLLGPGNYTVTFTDGECFTHTEEYYFEPCNTELYDPANPAVMQMTDLKVRCKNNGSKVGFRSHTVAKCCDCTGSGITIKVTNSNGLATSYVGGVTTEAGCQPAESFFKKVVDYDSSVWTEFNNTVEVFDCEDNLIYTIVVDDPCN